MRRMATAVMSIWLLLLLAACGGRISGTPEAQKAGGLSGALTLYTSMQPSALKKLRPLMEKALPGVQLEIFQAGTEKLIAKLAAEMEAKKVAADVLMVADPAYYLTLKQKEMLLPYRPKGAEDVLGERDAEGYFTSVRAINAVIGYNTRLVRPEEAPKRFIDLADPKWKGAIAMVDPTLSGSAFATVAALAGVYGWEYFERLRANEIQIVDGHGTLQSKLVAGEFKAVILLEMNLLAAMQKGDPVGLVYPEDGVVMLPSPIAILSSTRNPQAAKALVDWWFGSEGQGALSETNQHPIIPGYASPAGARSIEQIRAMAIPINWQEIANNYEQIKERFAGVMK